MMARAERLKALLRGRPGVVIMVEAESWIAAQPKNSKGKVDIQVVIAEGKRRGYCICPKPMRQMIDFTGLTCTWCEMPETKDSWRFWYDIISAQL